MVRGGRIQNKGFRDSNPHYRGLHLRVNVAHVPSKSYMKLMFSPDDLRCQRNLRSPSLRDLVTRLAGCTTVYVPPYAKSETLCTQAAVHPSFPGQKGSRRAARYIFQFAASRPNTLVLFLSPCCEIAFSSRTTVIGGDRKL